MSNEKRFVVKHGLQSQNIEFISPDRSKNMSLAISNNGSISFSGIGNVGVGTTTPVSRLQIVGGSINTGGGTGLGISSDLASGRFVAGPSVAAIASSQDASTVEISAGSTGGQSGVAVSGSGGDQPSTVRFFSNNAERMRITSAGNVGIGTTAPSTKLDVNGAITFATNGSGTNYLRYERTATNVWSFTSDGVGEIYRVSGNVVQFKQNVLVEREGLTVQPTMGTSPAITVNHTWNNVNTTFTGIQANVTNTASSATSSLLDLRVGGSSLFSVRKDGAYGIDQFRILPSSSLYGGILFSGAERVRIGSSFVELNSSGHFSWSSTSNPGSADTFIYRDAANTLAQRNGIIAQTSRIYNTYTDASNYERAKIGWNANVLEIGTENAGTGTLRNINLIGGNVGIGIAAPLHKLHISSGNNTTTQIGIGTSAEWGDSVWRFVSAATNYTSLGFTNGTTSGSNNILEALAVTRLGNVGIGTTSPGNPLTVSRSLANVAVSYFNNTDTADGNGILVRAGGANAAKYIASFQDAAANTRMHILSNGNVGVGTSTPSTKLHLVGTSGNILIRLDDAVNPRNNYIGVDNYEQVVLAANESNTAGATPNIKFRINASELMRILPSGNVGIGTTTPSAKLDVAGDIEVNSNVNLNSEATTLATVTKTQVASFPVASFRSGKLIVQAYDSVTGEVQISELLVVHNGTTASATEYGVVFTGASSIVIYDVDISAGNVRLMATRTTANSTQYKTSETLMVA